MNHLETEVNHKGYIDDQGQSVRESLLVKWRRPIAAATASIMLATGVGALAEEDKTLPQNSETSTEAGLNGIETPEEVLQKQGIENNETGQVIAETLNSTETEKSPEQVIAENIINYLNEAPGYTDEEIKSGLITIKNEETEDLGLIHTRNIQGIFLGSLEDSVGDNLFLLLGVKDVNQKRFVTSVRIPLYVLNDTASPFKFTVANLNSLSLNNGGSGFQTKDSSAITDRLDDCLGRNLVVNLNTDKITSREIDKGKNCGANSLRYIEEIKEAVYYTRSLDADVFRNSLKLEYPDPNLKIFRIDTGSDEPSIITSLNSLVVDNISTRIPVILGMSSYL